MPDTVLESRLKTSEHRKNPCFCGAYNTEWEIEKKQSTDKMMMMMMMMDLMKWKRKQLILDANERMHTVLETK